MSEDVSESNKSQIPMNLRLLLVLEEVARAGVPITPTTVNAKIGLPKPTIHRLFTTLEEEGFVQRELDGRSYSAGKRLRDLSVNVLSSLRIRTARLVVMNKLAEKIGETCNLAIPDRDSMLYLDRVDTKWPLRIQMPIGTHVPFYCTASGKMYLSSLNDAHLNSYLGAVELEQYTEKTFTTPDRLRDELRTTQERGYAQDNEEFMDGMIALAVPILDNQDRLLSTISFHAPVQRLTLEQAYEHLSSLRLAAAELSALVSDDLQAF